MWCGIAHTFKLSLVRFVDECGVLGEVNDSPNLRIQR